MKLWGISKAAAQKGLAKSSLSTQSQNLQPNQPASSVAIT